MRHDRTLADVESFLPVLRDFHGHVGPYVIAGVRMGLLARRLLGCEPHFALEVEVRCPDAPPPSCALDGIQFASGCTLGKRNIRHTVAEGVSATFRERAGGAEVTVTLREGAIGPAVAVMMRDGDEAAAAVVLATPESELFDITRG